MYKKSKNSTYHPQTWENYRMHINQFTSGYSPSFKWPAQDVIEEMKECLILCEEKFKLSNVTLFLSFHTAQRRLDRAAFHNFLASFLIGRVDHPIIKSLIRNRQTHSIPDKAMRRAQNLQIESGRRQFYRWLQVWGKRWW